MAETGIRSVFSTTVDLLTTALLGGVPLIVGSLLVVTSFFASSVRDYKKELVDSIVHVDPAKPIDLANDGKMIYFTGVPRTTDTPVDPSFGVAAPGALRLKRAVEMYQWKERRHKERGLTGNRSSIVRYSYVRTWSVQLLDSSRHVEVGHTNPKRKPMPDLHVNARDVTIGPYALYDFQVSDFHAWNQLPMSEVTRLPANATKAEKCIYLRRSKSKSIAIGDGRVRHYVVKPRVYTVLGRQAKNRITTYNFSNDEQFCFIVLGVHSPETLLHLKTPEQKAEEIGQMRLLGLSLVGLGLFVFVVKLFSFRSRLLEAVDRRT